MKHVIISGIARMQMLCGHNMVPRLKFSWQFFSYYMLAMGHGAYAPQDFAMFEPNNTCILTIQLHLGFFRLIQLFKKPYKLPTINKIKNKPK